MRTTLSRARHGQRIQKQLYSSCGCAPPPQSDRRRRRRCNGQSGLSGCRDNLGSFIFGRLTLGMACFFFFFLRIKGLFQWMCHVYRARLSRPVGHLFFSTIISFNYRNIRLEYHGRSLTFEWLMMIIHIHLWITWQYIRSTHPFTFVYTIQKASNKNRITSLHTWFT